MTTTIRLATEKDFEFIWPFFQDIARSGETYGYDRNISFEDAKAAWIDYPRHTFVAIVDEEIVGSYYIVSNHAGPGKHVCNCGYMVARQARGQGLATALCEHSQEVAQKLGYLAMQFNFVASSNEGAIALWHRLGFQTVGQLPKAFNHPKLGFVDALVMYKALNCGSLD